MRCGALRHLSAAWARAASTLTPWSSGAARVVPPPEDLNHDELAKAAFRSRELVRGRPGAPPPGGAAAPRFAPSPASQMCQGLAFGYSAVFAGAEIAAGPLRRAVAALAAETPVVAGRVAQTSRRPPGLRPLAAAAVDLNDAGVELVLAEARGRTVTSVGPETWTAGLAGKRLDAFGVPFYAEPFSVERMHAGAEPLLKVKRTALADGCVLSCTVSHLVADAGRAVRLAQRLGELYRAETAHPGGAAAAGGEPLRADGALETPEGFAAALAAPPPAWTPAPPDWGLTARQWLALPELLRRHAAGRHDVHLIYLPAAALARIKAAAQGGPQPGGARLSTMDAAQALLSAVVAGARGRPLVATAPEELTVNVDLLHAGLPFRVPGALARHLGNAVHILHVPGVPAGDARGRVATPAHGAEPAAARAALAAAVQTNARLIRAAVGAFRADAGGALRALARQARLVALSELRVAAAFVGKGADMKAASCTSTTAFDWAAIDFGGGAPRHAHISYQPRFDAWTILQPALSYGGSAGGVLCSVTLEAGLQTKLVTHPAWRLLAPEAHIVVADGAEERRRLAREAKSAAALRAAAPSGAPRRAPAHAGPPKPWPHATRREASTVARQRSALTARSVVAHRASARHR
jgi:hypothetical protein